MKNKENLKKYLIITLIIFIAFLTIFITLNVIQYNTFNKNTKMVIVCPITSNEKYFPTHYNLEDTTKVHGAVLCEHIRSIDYEIRNLQFVEKLSDNDIVSIITLLNACIEE